MNSLLGAFKLFGGWIGKHKILTGGTITVLLVSILVAGTYIYIQNLQSTIVEQEIQIEEKEQFANTLIADIDMQNEAISELYKEQQRKEQEARERLERELDRQSRLREQITPSEDSEELNKWLLDIWQ